MRLSKHHGLGNDFLVLLDLEGAATDLGAVARAACHRHRGVGADGLIHVTRPPKLASVSSGARRARETLHRTGLDGPALDGPGLDGPGGPELDAPGLGGPGLHRTSIADVAMGLYNADGTRAEMSGNGIACLAQALVAAGLAGPDRVEVATDAGRRSVEVAATETPRHHRMRVDMGRVTVGEAAATWTADAVLAAATVNIGNPHVVLRVEEPAKFPIEDVGRRLCETTPGGTNVEAVAPAADGGLSMVVYERGVGRTEACGTGACAAAAAAANWGLAGDRVMVTMPGGTTEVELGATVHMTTTVVHVATVEFHWP
ncbi:MAG: diaminopimelate epimerase [Acidimicrobiales bacterium]